MGISPLYRLTIFLFLLGLLGFTSGTANVQAQDPEQLQRGAQLYVENCAVCHGADGQGRVGATLAKDWPAIRPEATVKSIIERGVPGSLMPAWAAANGGPLSPEDVDALVLYILSWQTGGAGDLTPLPTATPYPPITPIPDVEGDPNAGAVLFAENCVVCHGEQGQGRIGATLAKDWPSFRPDLSVKTAIVNGLDDTRMPAWSSANGGPLSDDEVNNLVAYIMTFPPVVSNPPEAQPTPEPAPSVFSGWTGVLLFLVLIAVIFGVIYFLQRRKAE